MDENKFCYKYPHPAVTTDCVIFGFDGTELNVLLVRRGIEPYKGRWAMPGGFLNPDESAEDGARRELMEETGLGISAPEYGEKSDCPYIEQFHAYSAPDRDPRERVITIAYLALVKIQDVEGGDDAADARWFPVSQVPPLAFDHDAMLRDALTRLRERIHFHPIGSDLLPERFSLRQLQTLYEAILGVRFDRRNFAKKMLHLEILTETEEPEARSNRREAKLYSFNIEKYNDLKKRGFRLEF